MKPQQCMLAGVSLPVDDHGVADYDELLREALRALRIENEGDAFRVLHGRITQLMDAYIESPAGRRLNPAIMMSSLAVCLIDVIPLAERKQWLRRAAANYADK